MSIPVIAFFSNRTGVGTTFLTYHLMCMFSDLGNRVIAADLDPQAGLTVLVFDRNHLESLRERLSQATISSAIRPLFDESGNLGEAHVEPVTGSAAMV